MKKCNLFHALCVCMLSCIAMPSCKTTNGHDYVDLGLTVKWATCNVGASSPQEYGDYYAWGETETKANYQWCTYFDTYYFDESIFIRMYNYILSTYFDTDNDEYRGFVFTKYNNDGGKTTLDPEDDAAHINWGGSWRMPTKAEWEELENNCTWIWTTQNGINGYRVTSNIEGYTDKFIFLPATGFVDRKVLCNVGLVGGYWSSSLFASEEAAWCLGLSAEDFYDPDSNGYHHLCSPYRYNGQSVRPVLP